MVQKLFALIITSIILNITASAQLTLNSSVQKPSVSSVKINNKALFEVTGINVSIDSTVHNTSANSTTVYFKAEINYVGIGGVSYSWITINKNSHSNIPASKNNGTLTTNGSGKEYIFYSKEIRGLNPFQLTLQTISPNQVISNKVDY